MSAFVKGKPAEGKSANLSKALGLGFTSLTNNYTV